MTINLGILALHFFPHQIILNDFLKLSEDTSLKVAPRESFRLVLHSAGTGYWRNGSIFYRQPCIYLLLGSESWVASMEWCLSSELGAEVTINLSLVPAMYDYS